MKTQRKLFSSLVLLGMMLTPANTLAEGIAIHAGKVHTLTGDALDDAIILVKGGRVEAVAQGINVPRGYEVMDARDKVVTPGLVESYSRFGIQEIALEASTRDDRVQDYPLGPALDVVDAFNDASVLFAVNREGGGVTRAVVAPDPGNDPLAGWAALIRLTQSEQITNTQVAMFGSLMNSRFSGGSRAAVFQRLREGFTTASSRRQLAVDPREYRRADIAALRKFMASNAPLVLAVNRASDIRRAVQFANGFDVRLIILGGNEAWKVADLLSRNDVGVIVDVFANMPGNYDSLGSRIDNAALLHAAGVRVMLTAEETQHAYWLRQLAGNAVSHGLPWDAALAAITVNPARAFGFPRGVGQIIPGGAADLVVWSGDPLEITNWVERVMIDGTWQPMQSRQTRLYERYKTLADDAEGLPPSYR